MVPYNDIQALIETYKGKYFRFWRYKKPGVSYSYFGEEEVSGPYIDEHCDTGRLVNAYELPDGDLLLCFEDDTSSGVYQDFVKLSEIDLAYSDYDQEDEDGSIDA